MMKSIIVGLISMALIGSSSLVFADDLDIRNINNGKTISFFDLVDDQEKFLDILIDNPMDYIINIGGEFYKVSEVSQATKNGVSAVEAVKKLNPVKNDTINDNFEVTDII